MSEFSQLLEREIPGLRRYARGLTRDVECARDLVQSCLVRALAKQHLWQPDTDLRAWLYTIMHNLRISDIRRAVRERDGAAAIAPFGAGQSEPDARLEVLDLDRAIGKLSQRQRRLVLLIGLEGMRYDQAAALFAVPVGTIRSQIGRARDRLRQVVRGEARPGRHHATHGAARAARRRPVAAASAKPALAGAKATSRIRPDRPPPPRLPRGRRSPAPSSPHAA